MHSKNTGFTIVEAIIVIAVAGIILLMVLLALPALQRSGHNDRKRHDVQTILEAVSQYEINNSGSLPPNTATLRNYLKNHAGKLSYYSYGKISMVIRSEGNAKNYKAGLQNGTTVGDTVTLYNYQKCLSQPSGFTTSNNAGAGFNDVVALYAIDTRSGRDPACEDI
jgi:type II secretory pathway pseudopilin PulG